MGSQFYIFLTKSIVDAFTTVGIDAAFGEKTPDNELSAKVEQYKALSVEQKTQLIKALRATHSADIEAFVSSLRVALSRQVEFVHVVPLHGFGREMVSVEEAISYIEGYDEAVSSSGFIKYALIVRYNNGAKIDGEFPTKVEAIEFLRRMI